MKGSEPDWLIKNAVAKTREYVDAPDGQKPSPWRQKDIVDRLKEEAGQKCIYCEAAIDVSDYSAVEHIRPKSKFPEEVLRWSNLGLICARCNTNKGSYWTESVDLQLLNPFVDDPAAHLNFVGPLTVSALGSSRGANTVRKLKLLERTRLLMARAQRIEELRKLIELWYAEKQKLFAEDINQALSPEKEHTAVLRAFAEQVGFAPSPMKGMG